MNAYEVKALKTMGVDITKLGCVMLDVEKPNLAGLIPEEWAYTARNPERHWIKGLDAGDHITLLFGLLENANTIRGAVDEVMDGWEPGYVTVKSIGSFPSTFADEPYACIVAHIEVTVDLLDAHSRLSLLPHIDTHPSYKPHLTLGYVHEQYRDAAVARLSGWFKETDLRPLGLNYGRRP